ncbi:MAG TPA: NlpC/P60 family protein [Candidatus Limnocylindrales bacterium]|nr:NlpC/P60 family protein [Candidatus Limnocylindrales bacterium]
MSFVTRASRFVLLVSALICLVVSTTAPVAAGGTELDRVLSTARNQIGDRYKHFGRGPDLFDCVGFVWYAFKQNNLQTQIGFYRGVAGYWDWFKARGLIAASNPRVGDLIVWGQNTHIGIYLGPDQAISALVNPRGVSVHPIRKSWIGMGVKGYLRVNIQRTPEEPLSVPPVTPSPTPTATPTTTPVV